MIKYLQKVKDLTSILKYFKISHISRAENTQADVLSQLATTSFSLLDRMFFEYLEQPNINKVKEVLQINDEPSWIYPIIQYLID